MVTIMKNNAVFNKIKGFIGGVFASKKNVKMLTFFLCGIVLLIFFSGFFGGSKNENKTEKRSSKNISVSEYCFQVESKIEDMIFATGKVKKVSAFVMIESSPEVKYLTETKEENSIKNDELTSSSKVVTVVFEKNGSVSTPVVVATISPKICGVMIVMSRVDASTKISIQNALAVVLNIDVSCISILQES